MKIIKLTNLKYEGRIILLRKIEASIFFIILMILFLHNLKTIRIIL